MRALNKMPETAAYRIHTEKIITERARIVATVRNQQLITFLSIRMLTTCLSSPEHRSG